MADDVGKRPDGFGIWIRGWDLVASFALLVAAYLLVRLDAVPQLLALAGDKSYFARKPLLLDTFRHGYGFDNVRDHLRALGEDGRAYYAHTYIPIHDLALSLFLLTFCILFILYATQMSKGHALWLPPWVRRLFMVPPVLQFLFDVGENLTLRQLMEDFPRVSVKVVEAASQFTQLKWFAIYVTTLILIGLAVFTFYRLLMVPDSDAKTPA